MLNRLNFYFTFHIQHNAMRKFSLVNPISNEFFISVPNSTLKEVELQPDGRLPMRINMDLQKKQTKSI